MALGGTRLGTMSGGLALACALLFAGPAAAQQGQELEPLPVLRASQVLPPELLSGQYHRVEEQVTNDGLINTYRVNSVFGTLEVRSTELLYRRVHELSALAAMDEVRQSKVFMDALGKAAVSPVKGAVGVVTDPVNTISGAVEGTGKFFNSLGHSLFGSPSEQEAGVLATAVGYDSQKRKIAFEYGVDPYSYNPLLQERLVELARAATAGGVAVKVGFSFIPGPGRLAVSGTSLTNQMNKLVQDKTPAELKGINRKKLDAMGVAPALSEPFLDHPKFSPSTTTHLVGALEQMPSVEQRDLYIARAVLLQDEVHAFLYERRAKMLLAYHTKIEPIGRFLAVNRRPFTQTRSGRFVILVPTDYITWDQTSAPIIDNMMAMAGSAGATGYELWVTGDVSPLVRRNLEARGWTIVTDANTQLQIDQ